MRISVSLFALFIFMLTSCHDSKSVIVPSADFEITRLEQNQISVKPVKTNTTDDFIYEWHFGDQSMVVTNMAHTHTYSETGSFDITLQVRHIDGLSANTTQTVTITNTPPIADFFVRYAPLTLKLNAQTSQDETTLSYLWTIQNDQLTGQSIEYLFTQTGNVDVTLTVTDVFGLSHSSTQTLNVSNNENSAPQAFIASQQNNHLVKLIGTNSFDIDKDYLSYEWQLEDNIISTQGNVYYEFEQPGEHVVTLTIFDGNTYVKTTEMFTVTNSERNIYDLALYQNAIEIAGRCTGCHSRGSFYITDTNNLTILRNDLTDYIRNVSAHALIGFPSETNGFVHSGYRFIAGQDRFVEGGVRIEEDELPAWENLVNLLDESQ